MRTVSVQSTWRKPPGAREPWAKGKEVWANKAAPLGQSTRQEKVTSPNATPDRRKEGSHLTCANWPIKKVLVSGDTHIPTSELSPVVCHMVLKTSQMGDWEPWATTSPDLVPQSPQVYCGNATALGKWQSSKCPQNSGNCLRLKDPFYIFMTKTTRPLHSTITLVTPSTSKNV